LKKQTFLKGSLMLGASAILAKVLGAFFKIPLTNALGGTGMGYFSSAYGLFLPLYAVLVTGLSTAVAKPVAACCALGDQSGAERICRVARRLFLGLGLLGTLAAILCAVPFARYTTGAAEAVPAVIAIAPAVLFSCLTAVERGYCEGCCCMMPTAVSQAAEALCKLICGLWFCRVLMENPSLLPFLPASTPEAAGAAGAVLGVTLSTAAGWLCMLLYCRKRVPSGKIPPAPVQKTWHIIRMLFAVMLPVAAGALITNLTSLIDLATVMRFFHHLLAADAAAFYEGTSLVASIPPEEAATFVYGSFMGLSMTVFNLVPSLTNMFGKGVLPCTAQAWAAGDRKAAAGYAAQVLVLTGLLAIPAGCGLFALPEGVLAFLYGERPAETAAACEGLRWLAPGMLCLCLAFPVFSLMQAMGRADLPVKIMGIGAAVKLMGNLVLLPLLYTGGAALSTSLCYGVILVLSLYHLRRLLGVRLSLVKPFAVMAYAGVMCAGTAWLCYGRLLLRLPQRIALLLAIACGGVMYGAIVLGLMGKEVRGLGK